MVSPGAGQDAAPRIRWAVVAVPMAIAALARGAYWRVATPGWVPDSDAEQYLRISAALARGQGYSLVYPQLERHATAYRPPLYPAVAAVVLRLTGTGALWGVRLLSLVLGVAVVGLLAWYALRLAGPLAAIVAGTVAALSPQLIANDTVSLSEPLALALLVGLLLALLDRRVVWCGVLSGLLVLTRPNAYLVVAIVAVALWRTVGWRRALATVAIAAAVVVPWMVRNQLQVGTWRPITSDGFTMAAVYGPEAMERGEFVDPVLDPAYDGTDLELWSLGDEGEWSSRLTRLALSSVRQHPTYVADVVGRNLGALVEVPPSSNDGPELLDGRDPDVRAATLPWFYVVTVVGLVGLVLERRRRELWPVFAITAQFVLLSLVLVTTPRLRAPVDLVMCLGVGLWAVHAAAWWHRRRGVVARPA